MDVKLLFSLVFILAAYSKFCSMAYEYRDTNRFWRVANKIRAAIAFEKV